MSQRLGRFVPTRALLPGALSFTLHPRLMTAGEPLICIVFATRGGKTLDRLAHGVGSTWDEALAELRDQTEHLPDGSVKRAAQSVLASTADKTAFFERAIAQMKAGIPGEIEFTENTPETTEAPDA